MFWRKIFGSLLLAVALFLPSQVSAQTNTEYFDTKLHTTVNVNTAGTSRIKHEITITNRTPTTFISQYGLKISSAKLSNISVISDGQLLEPEIVQVPTGASGGAGQTSIGITFPDKVVGEGKSRNLVINYTHPDSAVISGNVLEVTLPPQATPQDYSAYKVTLITPAFYGGPIRTTPEQHSYTATGNQYVTTFNGGADTGIFALFGSQQLYQLDLEYQLQNTNNNTGITQIALPPDTSYQRVYIESLEPKPQEIEADEDGNWVATYQVPGGKTTTVKLSAIARLTLEANSEVPVYIPNEELLKSQEFWPVNNNQIKDIVSDLLTPYDINNYVVETLSYGEDPNLGLNRLGAIGALNDPEMAVCQEYTDLFVTLARARNIPARRITGYAQSQNQELRPLSLIEDVLHAWPEYYDQTKGRWIPIDPTWEDTTGGVDYFHQLDLNHIAFAINGHDSQAPYPAGSYKPEGTNAKTVNVTFAEDFPEVEPELELALKPAKLFIIPLPGIYNLEITNETGSAHYKLPVKVTTNSDQTTDTEQEINILPFQTLPVNFRVENSSGWLPQRDTITVSVYDQTQEFGVISIPQIDQLTRQPQLAIGVAIGAVSITLVAGSLLVFRRKTKRPLRRKS